jgi:hypothetical protein
MENETAGAVHVPYASVNGAWPEGPLPVPTGPEAIAGARLLIREGFRFHGIMHEVKRKRKFKLTSGRRHTWPSRGVWAVNPNYRHRPGWPGIVHSISHYVHRRAMPGWKPHDCHAMTERHLVEYVVSKGWLSGALAKPERVKVERDVKAERAANVAARLAKWERKKLRAETALKKLRRQAAYYGVANA